MKELVFVEPKGREPYTTSEVIAECTGIAHRKIRDAIRKYENDLETFGVLASYQAETTANKEGGRKALVYRLNEQQAAFLLTLLKNTPVVVAFKKELVRQFYAMRSLLFEKTTPLWQDTRQMGKEIRQRETDSIKAFIEYAQRQGSKNAQRYYINFSKLADQAAGIKNRELATAMQLNTLQIIERIISVGIHDGITSRKPYKAIFADCKARLSLLCNASMIEKSA
mgnify:CR=1 FL=1